MILSGTSLPQAQRKPKPFWRGDTATGRAWYNPLTMDETTFAPPQHPGLLFQLAMAALLAFAAGMLYYHAALLPVGATFLLMLTGALLLTLPVPLLLYGAYALRRAAYTVNRDRITLQWGWWIEEIPMTAVQWAQTPAGLETPLPLPRVRWPGMVVGTRHTPAGKITFMAADTEHGVVIATDYGLYVLSPASPEAFLKAFRRAAEEGALEPATARFQRPTRWLAAIWHDRWARALLLLAWLATLLALVWSNIAASGITWPAHAAPSPTAVAKAVFLAIAAWLFQGINLGLGLFAYQSPQRRAMAYLIWLVGAVAAAGFLASVAVVLTGGAA